MSSDHGVHTKIFPEEAPVSRDKPFRRLLKLGNCSAFSFEPFWIRQEPYVHFNRILPASLARSGCSGTSTASLEALPPAAGDLSPSEISRYLCYGRRANSIGRLPDFRKWHLLLRERSLVTLPACRGRTRIRH